MLKENQEVFIRGITLLDDGYYPGGAVKTKEELIGTKQKILWLNKNLTNKYGENVHKVYAGWNFREKDLQLIKKTIVVIPQNKED